MKHVTILAMVCIAQLAIGQKFFSKTGKISFSSTASMEKIEATNSSANTVIDLGTGNMEWAVLIQGFQFEKSLMKEHFNENYMESSKYPKAVFKGKIDNLSGVNLAKDGVYDVTVSGQLEIHGVSKPVTTQGTLTIKKGIVTSAFSKLSVALADYGIEIPKLVADNISKTVNITIQADYQLLNAIP
jgi:polyisoprenoid-binding protein YceI